MSRFSPRDGALWSVMLALLFVGLLVTLSTTVPCRRHIRSDEDDSFESCGSFRGKKEGYVYKLGEKGLGYYKDRR